MTKHPENHRKSWSRQDVAHLRELARQNTPTRVIGHKMGRTPEAVYAKASDEGISLRPWNQKPYNRRPR
jgi:hypothetical protein